ncbi:Transcriptional regulator, AraC family protein [Minicystis rosea]|nr:Transcriptional regulator, AraC family protein [Minicystis rosea]
MTSGITPESRTRGILNPAEGLKHFELRRHAPAPDLAALVDWHWVVRWSLAEPFEQEVLPHATVNLAIEPGVSAVHGIGTVREVARLVGTGRVVATKFKPGGFHPFTRVPMRELVNRVIPIVEAFGEAAADIVSSVLAEPDDALAVAAVEAFLRAHRSADDLGLTEAMTLAVRAENDREIHRAEDLAKVAGVSLRTLHRSFEKYIGVGPKWIIRRSRVHEAAERVATGAPVVWAALALELGYHDQAHLIRDFKAQIGFTPAVYAERCAAARAMKR